MLNQMSPEQQLADDVSRRTGIGIQRVDIEDDLTDGGFNWSVDDTDYQVQIANYANEPFLLHRTVEEGIQLIASCATVDQLCEEITKILTSN